MASQIETMFGRITPTYDRVNAVLSLGLDRIWRHEVIKRIPFKHGKILDTCTGTGDLAIALAKKGYQVTGIDFCAPMLARAEKKAPKGVFLEFIEADASCLPFQDRSFLAVTGAFSLRNLPDLKKAFKEAFRVLSPGGSAFFLDLTLPETWLGPLHRFYLSAVLPSVGGLISGDKQAYHYLASSIFQFQSNKIGQLLLDCGFIQSKTIPLSAGICTLWTALKS